MKSRRSWDEYLIEFFKYFFVVVFFGGILYLMYYIALHDGKFSGAIPERVIYINNWVYSAGDVSKESVEFPCDLGFENDETVTYESKLPGKIKDGDFIAIFNSRDIIVKINGVNRFKWSRDSVDIPGGIAKSEYMFVPLTSLDAGKKIEIIKFGPGNNGVMHSVIAGDSLSLTNELKRISGMKQFFFACFIFVLSAIIVLCGLVLKKLLKQEIGITSISTGIMATAAWLMLDSHAFQLVTGIEYVDGFLTYILTFIMIFPFLIYFDKIQEGRYKKIYAVLGVVELINFVLCTLLHVFGISSYFDLLIELDMVIVWIIIVVCGCTTMDILTQKSQNYQIVSVGLMFFMTCSVIEIIMINKRASKVDGVFILCGLSVLLVTAVMQQIKDINENFNRQSLVVEAEKARIEFLSKMSHEIRTPINAILGMNEMILQTTDKPQIQEYAERIGRSGQVLMSLVNDILDYSNVDDTEDEFIINDFDIRKTFESVVAVLRENATAKNLGVNVGLPGNLPLLIRGDERHLKRVLSNIISNAVKFTQKGSVTFAVECEETEAGYNLEIIIQDTGIGIEERKLPHIFEGFSYDGNKGVKSNEGAGLGLSVAKKIITDLGGTIEVESHVGMGSVFTVKVPMQRANVDDFNKTELALNGENGTIEDGCIEQELVSYNKDTDAVNHEGHRHDSTTSYIAPDANILAVDDNSANLVVVKEFLKCIEVNFDEAPGGLEAIEMCKNKKYDLIFMDHMMPDPDGIATMHIIKESISSLNRTTPIVVLTANVVCDCKKKYLKEGFDDYMSKPVVHNELLKMVRKYIDPKLITEKDEMISQSDSSAMNSSNAGAEIIDDNAGIINYKALYGRFENQEAVVNMVLSECVKEGEKKILLLPELFAENDIARYAVEAHGVKGVMASICAEEFSARAKQHEFAAKEGRVDFIREDIEGFIAEYRNVLDYITDYLAKKGIVVEKPRVLSNADGQVDEYTMLIDGIEDALNGFDVDNALKLIEKLKSIADESKIDKIEEVRRYTDDFEYDKAIEILGELK